MVKVHQVYFFLLAFVLLCLVSPASCVAAPRNHAPQASILRHFLPSRTSVSARRNPITKSQVKEQFFNRDTKRELVRNLNYYLQHSTRKPDTTLLSFDPKKIRELQHSFLPNIKTTEKLKNTHFKSSLLSAKPFEEYIRSRAIVQSTRQEINGFTGAPCASSADCAGLRVCETVLDGSIVPCDGRLDCVCLPIDKSEIPCSCEDIMCLTGDVCSVLDSGNACITSASNFPPLDCPGTPESAPSSETDSDSDGFTGDPCASSADCAGLRVCEKVLDGSIVPCDGRLDCVCLPIDKSEIPCSCEDIMCLTGDVCSVLDSGNACITSAFNFPPLDCPGTPKDTPSPGTSPAPGTNPPVIPNVPVTSSDMEASSPTPSPTENVCIDAKALTHLKSHELVYDHHAVSTVLCDKFGSCATPGHIVHYNGSTMMMKTYCETAGCEEQIMEVNSPRYRKGMKISSKTTGLEYTAYAARYGTRTEEVLMATAVRIGL